MSARDSILAKLHGGPPVKRRDPPLRPAVHGDPVRLFVSRLQAAAASCEHLARLGQVPDAVSAYRCAHQLGGPVAVAPALAGLAWSGVGPTIGSCDENVDLGVSLAQAGVAETGSLVMLSGPDTPTRLNFLPDHHLVVVHTASILRHLEDALLLLDASLPRALNLITGPSRTADVEQTIQLGAHGPRALHVLLIK